MRCLKELREYSVGDEGSWVLSDDFLGLIGKLPKTGDRMILVFVLCKIYISYAIALTSLHIKYVASAYLNYNNKVH